MFPASPFMKFFTPPGRTEQNLLFGFSLVSAPASSNTDAHVQERILEGLQLRIRLINALWDSNITALDLRFVKQDTSDIAIGLLCRLTRPAHILHNEQFSDYALSVAMYITQLLTDNGYTLVPLPDEASLSRYLNPFHFQALADARRREDLLLIQYTYTEYEIYVPYPWQRVVHGCLLDVERVLQKQTHALISIYLEPTQLHADEQYRLAHATSPQVRNLLAQAGEEGQQVYNIYRDLDQSLQRPYLLRISVAASTPRAVSQIGKALIDELSVSQPPETTPVLQSPQHPHEWQAAQRNMFNLEWVPWGNIRDDVPETARLRYLVDSRVASILFCLPILPPVTKRSAAKYKVLLVFSNPGDTERLRLDAEDRLIREAIRLSRYRDNITLTVRHAATIHDLRRSLLDDEFQIVHIAGHGSDRGLVLEDEAGKASFIPQEALAELFKAYRQTLRCVILNACYSATQGQLISLGISFTIAMEGTLGDKAAREFTRGFYDALGAGRDFDFAYKEGCRCANLAAPDSSFVSSLLRSN